MLDENITNVVKIIIKIWRYIKIIIYIYETIKWNYGYFCNFYIDG